MYITVMRGSIDMCLRHSQEASPGLQSTVPLNSVLMGSCMPPHPFLTGAGISSKSNWDKFASMGREGRA